MSIAAQCSDCCDCGVTVISSAPTVTFTCESQTASGSLCGFSGYDDGTYDSGDPEAWEGQYRKWRYREIVAEITTGGCSDGCAQEYRYTIDGTAEITCAGSTGTTMTTTAIGDAGDGTCVDGSETYSAVMEYPNTSYPGTCSGNDGLAMYTATLTEKSIVQCANDCSGFTNNGSFGTATETLSGEVSLADAIAESDPETGTSCTASGGTIDTTSPGSTAPISFSGATSVTATITVSGGTPSSTVNIIVGYSNSGGADTYEEIAVDLDETGGAEFALLVPMPAPGETRTIFSVSVKEYSYAFDIPKTNCYRASWVERLVPSDGAEITSADVISAGVYRPSVTWSGGGGADLSLVAVMATDGSVSSIRVLNPGSGFTSAPTITVETAVNGGTTSTGWVATLIGDKVASVTRSGGSAGDYLPVGSVSSCDDESVSVSMDPQGGVSVSVSGTALGPGSAVSLLPKISEPIPAVILLHFGTEVARCYEWDGTTPGGYDPEDPTTWPSAGPYTLADGASVENFVESCDCTPCP